MTQPTPSAAPHPVEAFLKPTAQDQSQIAAAACVDDSGKPCRIPVQVGLFFDGTNNNMKRDLGGKRIGVPPSKDAPPPELPSKPMTPAECSHSNVVRLFNAFPPDKQSSGYHPYYIPGVGTEFKEIGEFTESDSGKAFSKGGLPRIVWGLLQVLNALHSTVYGGKSLLYEDDQAGQLVQDYGKQVGLQVKDPYTDSTHVMTHKEWFVPHIDKLKAALVAQPKPVVPSLTLSVFGFSRGAAQAAAFCHFFDDLLDGGTLAGIAARIQFLGVFDTVATVGTSHSAGKTLPLPGAVLDGHSSWAARILKALPGCVGNGLHCISAHELRMNFPVTQLRSSVQEVYFPGVHSDVGGGYGPGEQGKARGAQAELLSQIPLLHMYKAARKNGVPLTPYSELEKRDKADFEVSPALAAAWNAYTAELGEGGGLLKTHMGLYYRWRAARLYTLEKAGNFQAANAQDQQDLGDANRMLAGDLEALHLRAKGSAHATDEAPPFGGRDRERINQWHYIRANTNPPTSLDDWEKFALESFDSAQPLPAEVMRFFDDYVHDSYAGFYMAGPVTEFDKRKVVAEVMKKPPGSCKGFDKKVYEHTLKTQAAQKKKADGQALTPDEAALVQQAEQGVSFPTMTDADSADMRNPVITTQTTTRREGGGYILRRGYYPHHGFIFRESVNEEQLHKELPFAPPSKVKKDEPLALVPVWSDNIMGDLNKAQRKGDQLVAMQWGLSPNASSDLVG